VRKNIIFAANKKQKAIAITIGFATKIFIMYTVIKMNAMITIVNRDPIFLISRGTVMSPKIARKDPAVYRSPVEDSDTNWLRNDELL
jgi:uncharacterized membrane protein YcaP (DUF421 family)